jgi:hypothetical protein
MADTQAMFNENSMTPLFIKFISSIYFFALVHDTHPSTAEFFDDKLVLMVWPTMARRRVMRDASASQ